MKRGTARLRLLGLSLPGSSVGSRWTAPRLSRCLFGIPVYAGPLFLSPYSSRRPTLRLRLVPPLCSILVLGFAGCVGVAGLLGATRKAYEGPVRPDAELATVGS